MINVKDERAVQILNEIHDGMCRKIKRGKEKEDILLESRIFGVICHDFDMGPTRCAEKLNEKFGYDLTGDQVIQVFRSRRMANPIERKELLQWAAEVAELYEGAFQGNKKAFEKFEKRRKEPALKNGKRHDSQDRVAAIMIYEKFPVLNVHQDLENLLHLGNTLAKYFFYDMADAVKNVHGYQQKEERRKGKTTAPERVMSYEQAMRRVSQLENTLERTNTMLQELQDEFDELIEASKAKELADFFKMLNSEKYGCILDELLVVRKGMEKLKKQNYELPVEINGLLIMVKKLVQFVRDSHIDPIMKTQSIKEVKVGDIEFCNYEGSPFLNGEEVKKVRVISPGWIYRDKEIQISRPKVKEETRV